MGLHPRAWNCYRTSVLVVRAARFNGSSRVRSFIKSECLGSHKSAVETYSEVQPSWRDSENARLSSRAQPRKLARNYCLRARMQAHTKVGGHAGESD